MSFLTNSSDLTGTIFARFDLARIRAYASEIVREIAPDWYEAPRGFFGQMWLTDSQAANSLIVNVFYTTERLLQVAAERSMPVLHRKLVELLSLESEVQFFELFSELRVGCMFGLRSQPLQFEPLLSDPSDFSATRATSPDYGILLPEGRVLVEVTTMRFGRLEKWDRAMSDIRSRLTHALINRVPPTELEIESSIGFEAHKVSRLSAQKLCDAVAGCDSGNISCKAGQSTFTVRWNRIPIRRSTAGIESARAAFAAPLGASSAIVLGVAAEMPRAVSFMPKLVADVDFDQLLTASLENSFSAKRHQMRADEYSLLVLRLSDYRISADVIASRIERNIWTQQRFKRFAGAVTYKPRESYNVGAPHDDFQFMANPSAYKILPETFQDLAKFRTRFVDGTAQV